MAKYPRMRNTKGNEIRSKNVLANQYTLSNFSGGK